MTLILPTTATIADRAAELIATATRRNDTDATATRRNDTDAIAVLARVCENIAKGAQLRWDMYDLHVTSANRPAQYVVSCGVCDCPSRRPCWHIGAYAIALELVSDAADTADQEADEAARAQQLLAERLEATAQFVAEASARLGRRLCYAGRFAGRAA